MISVSDITFGIDMAQTGAIVRVRTDSETNQARNVSTVGGVSA